ncbi:MAG TPA: glycoside hydrolase family 43 protein [Longimicrobium sp.]|uniref:glycoside hydrolase family 43 protein n=1 Tax=Longimicrobium sp. TaxID=2029185 RepID=UPI002EDA2B1B
MSINFLQKQRVAGTSVLLALVLAACGGDGGGGTTVVITPPVQPTANEYVNPVLDNDFPDPAVMRSSDGWFYAFATQTTSFRVQVSRSKDLVNWSAVSEALPTRPAWASQSQNFWAPDVIERDGKYVMYFSTQIDAAQRQRPDHGFCIGMATAATAAGPYTDSGQPVVCGPSFTTIDPMAFDDPQTGKRLLFWGSAGSPLVVQELAADRRSFVPGTTPTPVVQVRNGGPAGYDQGLIEGPWVTFENGFYYLYFSGNSCCGANARYAVLVARSTSATGPYTVLTGPDGAAQPVLQAGGKWLAPGHNGVIRDAAGVEWMLYHAIDSSRPFLLPGNTDISRRPLLLDRIRYVNGWPVVGNSTLPTTTPQPRPTALP